MQLWPHVRCPCNAQHPSPTCVWSSFDGNRVGAVRRRPAWSGRWQTRRQPPDRCASTPRQGAERPGPRRGLARPERSFEGDLRFRRARAASDHTGLFSDAASAVACRASRASSSRRPEADIKPRQHWFGATALVTLIALAGVIWYHQAPDSRDGSLPDVQLRGSVDDASRARSVAAPGTASKAHESLPTVVIPDLTMAGFTFVSAETQPSRPASLSFHYLNAASETLVITVARATAAPMLPSAASSVSPWHSHDNTFALSGSVAPERLRVIASSLQANDPQ